MPIKILMHEPEGADYIFIDERNNLHVLLPIISGQTIGLDNTCKTHLQLKQFFGLEPGAKSAKTVLIEYKKALKNDIDLLRHIEPDGLILKTKIHRLRQLEDYISILKAIESEWRTMIDRPVDRYPVLPLPVRYLLGKRTNCVGMRLSPQREDPLLRTESPIFSVARRPRDDSGAEVYQATGDHVGLGPTLRQTFSKIFKKETSGYRGIIDEISDAVGRNFKKTTGWTDNSIKELIGLIESELKVKYNVDIICGIASSGYQPINQDYFELIFSADFHSYSPQEVASCILQASVSYQQWMSIQPNVFALINSPDGEHKQKEESERLSIKTQFFLAHINIYCYAKNILGENTNFGNIFDKEYCRDEIAQCVLSAVRNNTSVEEALLLLVNYGCDGLLELKRPLMQGEQKEIVDQFLYQYKTICESEHFDEFMIFLSENKGDFFNHDSRISVHILDVLSPDLTKQYPLVVGHTEIIKTREKRFLPSKNEVSTLSVNFLGLLKLLNGNKVSKYIGPLRINGGDLSKEEYGMLMCHPKWAEIRVVDMKSHNVNVATDDISHYVNYEMLVELLLARELCLVKNMLNKKNAGGEFFWDLLGQGEQNSLHSILRSMVEESPSALLDASEALCTSDEKKYINACNQYIMHLTLVLRENPKDELAKEKREIVFNALSTLLTLNTLAADDKMSQFRNILIEGKDTLCRRRDDPLDIFIKAIGVLGAAILGFGVGGYLAYEHLFSEKTTQGARFLTGMEISYYKMSVS